eukprot:5882556-Pyramimonas_sp.AAC.1
MPGRWPPSGGPSWRAYPGARIAGREAGCTARVTWASRGRCGKGRATTPTSTYAPSRRAS